MPKVTKGEVWVCKSTSNAALDLLCVIGQKLRVNKHSGDKKLGQGTKGVQVKPQPGRN